MDDDLELLEELDQMYESGRDVEDIGAISISSGSDSEDLDRTRDAEEGDDALDGPPDAQPEADGDQEQGLRATIIEITSALGGLEEVMDKEGEIQMVYQIGDDCLRCLRDLRTLWRQDESDATRLIPRLFAELNVLRSGLLPLLLKTAGTGERGDKIALACTDLITSITWPVDTMAELDDAIQVGDEIAQDNISHTLEMERVLVTYKSSILRVRLEETVEGQVTSTRDVLTCVMRYVLLPPMSKVRHLRTDRDTGTISMALHLFRNLLAIRDPQATALSSADMLATATLQSQLVCAMDKSKILETILFLASSSEKPDYEPWNAVAAECVYHLICGTDPRALAQEERVKAGRTTTAALPTESMPVKVSTLQAPCRTTSLSTPTTQSQSSLSDLLDSESRQKRKDSAKNGASRHSRFNSVITFTDGNGTKQVSRKQSSIRKSIAELRDDASARLSAKKRRGAGKRKRKAPLQERGAPRIKADWTPAARAVMRPWADRFLKGEEHAFEVLVRSILKDIRSEREKMGDLDEARIRIMYMGRFFLEYFVQRREETIRLAKHKAVLGKHNAIDADALVHAAENEWAATVVGEWLQPWAFKMVKVRTVESGDAKSWLEYTTSVQLWTVLLELVDMISRSKKAEESDVADNLQAQLYYQEDTLRVCKLITSSYKSQSFACMEAIISFAYNMPRMLERYSSDKENLYVRVKRVNRKARAAALADGDNEMAGDLAGDDTARAMAETTYSERRFTFQSFQTRLASSQLTDACMRYLSRWTEFTRPKEQLTMVVGVMHRIAVKAQNYRAFFPAPHRTYFRALLNSSIFIKLGLEAATPTNDLEKLLKFILKKFDKQSADEQAKWAGLARPRLPLKGPKIPAEIKAKAGIPLGDRFGIAIGLLLEKGKMHYVQWVRGALERASAQRTAISEEELLGRRIERRRNKAARLRVEVDTLELTDSEDDRHDDEIVSKFAAYDLGYDENEDLKRDASTLPELKMLCRLSGLESDETDPLAWKWNVAARVLPEHLDDDIDTIDKFIREPFDTDGAELSTFVEKIRKQRVPRAARDKTLHAERAEMNHFLEPDSDEASLSDTSANDDRPIRPNRDRAAAARRAAEDDALSPDSLDSSDDEQPLARRSRLRAGAESDAVTPATTSKRKKARPPTKERVKRAGKSSVPKKKVYRPPGVKAPRPKAVTWTANDFIEDSEEELAIVDRLLKERIAAKAAEIGPTGDGNTSETEATHRRGLMQPDSEDGEERDELDDDPNDVPPPIPRSRMRARKRARRAAALSGASSSPPRNGSASATSPPTSSPPKAAFAAKDKTKSGPTARPHRSSSRSKGNSLFLGDESDNAANEVDELMDEDDTAISQAQPTPMSPQASRRRSPSLSPTTALLRGGQLEDEDELISPVRPFTSTSRKRALALDSDEGGPEDQYERSLDRHDQRVSRAISDEEEVDMLED